MRIRTKYFEFRTDLDRPYLELGTDRQREGFAGRAVCLWFDEAGLWRQGPGPSKIPPVLIWSRPKRGRPAEAAE